MMCRLVKQRWLVAVLLGLLLASACQPESADVAPAEQITLAGSTSVEPFAELLAERYMHTYSDGLVINVQGGGSSAGVRAALSNAAEVGMSSRNLKSEEVEQGLATQLIARDAIAIIVHPSNVVEDLTLEQVRAIFAEQITSWADVGGADRPIIIVTREEGSGTRGAFEDLVMGDDGISFSALRQDSNGAVRVIIAGDRYAIGYISLGLVDDRVKAVRLDGIQASVENVLNDSYTLARPFLFLWTGEIDPAAQRFLDFVLSDEGQGILSSEGLVTGGA